MNQNQQPLCHSLSREQVDAVVHHFYDRVRADTQLAPHFAAIEDWPRHEEFITDFWWGVMGGKVAAPRPGAMIKGHQGLGITPAAIARWLALLGESIDALLPETEAQRWQTIARGIAAVMGEHGLVEEEE